MTSLRHTTPVESEARAELASVASAINAQTFSDSDQRILESTLLAVKCGLDATYAALSFFGHGTPFTTAEDAAADAIRLASKTCLEIVATTCETTHINDLPNHPSLSEIALFDEASSIRWLSTVPICGYNGLVVGALTLFDTRNRERLSTSEEAMVQSCATIIEATLESHRTRVIARAQRSLLVHRLRRAYAATVPLTNDYRQSLHDLSNAITILRLNSQVIEERQEFDAEAFLDMRNSIRLAENAAKGLRVKGSGRGEEERVTWTRLCDMQVRRIESMPQVQCRPDVHDESPNLVGKQAPSCLASAASMLVDRAIEACNGEGRLTISLRVFPHFVRFSVSIPTPTSLQESSWAVDPVYTHPVRNAVLATGGSIVADTKNDETRWTAWFPSDNGHSFVI